MAENNRQKRGRKVQEKWELVRQRQNLTAIVHSEDPDWAGPTSLYASTSQFLELGLDQQVLGCRVGGPGQLKQILCEDGKPVDPSRAYVFTELDPYAGRQYTGTKPFTWVKTHFDQSEKTR